MDMDSFIYKNKDISLEIASSSLLANSSILEIVKSEGYF